MSLFDVIPGYREAVEREQQVRSAGFLDVPGDICGIAVRALTLRHLVELELARSAFLVGGRATLGECAFFLWVVSVDRASGTCGQRRFARRCRKLPLPALAREIDGYLDEQMQDAPGGSGRAGAVCYTSWVADMAHIFATEYGWSDETTLETPVVRLMQYLKRIHRRADPKAPLFNPSDAVRDRWLREQNSKKG